MMIGKTHAASNAGWETSTTTNTRTAKATSADIGKPTTATATAIVIAIATTTAGATVTTGNNSRVEIDSRAKGAPPLSRFVRQGGVFDSQESTCLLRRRALPHVRQITACSKTRHFQ